MKPGNSVKTVLLLLLIAICLLDTTNGLAFAPAPPNDNFADAQVVSGPTHGGANAAGTRSVWYRYTAPANGMVTLDGSATAGVGSSGPASPIMAVYTGGSVGGLTAVASSFGINGGGTALGFNVTAGTTYSIAVDTHWFQGSTTKGTAYGNYTMRMVCPIPLTLLTNIPVVSSPSRSLKNMFGFQIGGLLGQIIEIETSTNLVSWEVFRTITLVSSSTNFTDSSAANFTRRFYRAVVRPQ